MEDLIEAQKLSMLRVLELAEVRRHTLLETEERALKLKQKEDLIKRQAWQAEETRVREETQRRIRLYEEEKKRCDDITNAGNMAAICACMGGC